jgi:hypothetical protein
MEWNDPEEDEETFWKNCSIGYSVNYQPPNWEQLENEDPTQARRLRRFYDRDRRKACER